MNTYTYTVDTISESQMLEYVNKMAYKVEPYVSSSFGPGDTMAFMQSVHKHLKSAWYGLCIAQMREDGLQWPIRKSVIRAFVELWQDRWLHTSIVAEKIYEKTHRQDVISGSCMGVSYIGEYCPFPEQIHEALNPVIWNGKVRL